MRGPNTRASPPSALRPAPGGRSGGRPARSTRSARKPVARSAGLVADPPTGREVRGPGGGPREALRHARPRTARCFVPHWTKQRTMRRFLATRLSLGWRFSNLKARAVSADAHNKPLTWGFESSQKRQHKPRPNPAPAKRARMSHSSHFLANTGQKCEPCDIVARQRQGSSAQNPHEGMCPPSKVETWQQIASIWA